MPIYEYSCRNCDHRLDALQKMSDDVLVDCPECGQPQLRRLISAPRFRLKGQGWYETDFKKDNQRNLSTGEDKLSKATEKTDSGKSDSAKADISKSDGGTAVSAKSDSKKSETVSDSKAKTPKSESKSESK